MNEDLSLDPAGERLVKAFENCLKPTGDGRFRAYICPAGKLTIGWGHTNDHGRKFDANSVWTQAECDAAFVEDMRGFEKAVRRLVTVELMQQQFSALVSFSYNCGEDALAGSTLLKKIIRDDFEGAAREFSKWVNGGNPKKKFNGLVRRRASESLMFQGIPDEDYDGIADIIDSEGGMPQKVEPPAPPKPTAASKTVQTATTVGTTVAAGAGAEVVKTISEAPSVTAPEHVGGFDRLLELVVSNADRIIKQPMFWMCLIAIVGCGYIIWDRRKKLHEENV